MFIETLTCAASSEITILQWRKKKLNTFSRSFFRILFLKKIWLILISKASANLKFANSARYSNFRMVMQPMYYGILVENLRCFKERL